MKRFLIIKNDVVVDVVEQEGYFNPKNYPKEFLTDYDSVQEDKDMKFKLGDTFDPSLLQSQQFTQDFIAQLDTPPST